MRDVILERRREEYHRALETEELVVRHICSSVYGSQGSKKGLKQASKIELFQRPKKIEIASEAQLRKLFSGGPGA